MAEKKKSSGKKKEDTQEAVEDKDFLYIVRIANKDLSGERKVPLALADLKGVGNRLAGIIVGELNLPKDKRLGDLSEEQIETLKNYVESREFEDLPVWLLNHRNDVFTGEDYNLVSNELDMQIQDDVNFMKKMRSYRGIRHEKGQKVRGQRTRSNGRHGLSVGVVRKREGR
ncbi:MAG TPA: 30S ribosomal protein S13 [Thermoplasmataceae archaeon]|nr:30S ribosomal protein S13 [Thermoplasmataceae archaeon]